MVEELTVLLYSGTCLYFGMSLHLTIKLKCNVDKGCLYNNAASSDYIALNLRMAKRSDKGPNMTYRRKFSSFLCAAFQSYSNDLVLTLYDQHHTFATISVSPQQTLSWGLNSWKPRHTAWHMFSCKVHVCVLDWKSWY